MSRYIRISSSVDVQCIKMQAYGKYSTAERCLPYFIIPVVLLQTSVTFPGAYGKLIQDEVFYVFRWAISIVIPSSPTMMYQIKLSPLKKTNSPVRTLPKIGWKPAHKAFGINTLIPQEGCMVPGSIPLQSWDWLHLRSKSLCIILHSCSSSRVLVFCRFHREIFDNGRY